MVVKQPQRARPGYHTHGRALRLYVRNGSTNVLTFLDLPAP